jgi:valyl-tRNA synthetase
MPFITEEIYQQLPLKSLPAGRQVKNKCLIVEDWPVK